MREERKSSRKINGCNEEKISVKYSQLVAVIVPWQVLMNVVVEGGAWSASWLTRRDMSPTPSQTAWWTRRTRQTWLQYDKNIQRICQRGLLAGRLVLEMDKRRYFKSSRDVIPSECWRKSSDWFWFQEEDEQLGVENESSVKISESKSLSSKGIFCQNAPREMPVKLFFMILLATTERMKKTGFYQLRNSKKSVWNSFSSFSFHTDKHWNGCHNTRHSQNSVIT